jgi:hypothetical protein
MMTQIVTGLFFEVLMNSDEDIIRDIMRLFARMTTGFPHQRYAELCDELSEDFSARAIAAYEDARKFDEA